MEEKVRDIICKALNEQGYSIEVGEELIFVDDEDIDKTVAIHLQEVN